MDNNDSMKPQQTGGLKLMTVFIFVLALHVVVIGGVTVYHLMTGESADADLVSTDKSHKNAKDGTQVTDNATLPDANATDKTAAAPAPATPSAPPTEVATIPAKPAAPAPETVTEVATPAPAPTMAPAPTPAPAPIMTPQPMASASQPEVVDNGAQTPSGPILSEPAPNSAPIAAQIAPLAPIVSGPVHMPAVAPRPRNEVSRSEAPKSGMIYVVKITDSYKKIAHAHHVTVAQLKEANHIHGDVLHTGQKLIIPSTHALVAHASPTELDSAPSTSVIGEYASESTSSLAASPAMAPTGLHHHLYTVVKGDTLSKIAHKFKTTSSAIMAANSMTHAGKLAIGRKLKIPSQESRSARNSTPAEVQPRQVQAQPEPASGELANFVP